MQKKLIMLGLFFSIFLQGQAWANYTCNQSLVGNVINDNIVVPKGASCHLNGVIVNGNVSSNSNSELMIANSQIFGHLRSQSSAKISLINSAVQSYVELKGFTPLLQITNTEIKGSLHCDNGIKFGGSNNFINGAVKCKR